MIDDEGFSQVETWKRKDEVNSSGIRLGGVFEK